MPIRRWPFTALIAMVFVAFLFLGSGARFYTDWLWLVSLDYQQTFLKILLTGAGLKITGTVIFFLFLLINLFLTRRYVLKTIRLGPVDAQTIEQNPWQQLINPRTLSIIFILTSILAALVFSSAMNDKWLLLQQYLNPVSFGKTDPLFGRDIGFFVFSLPFQLFVYRIAFGTVLFTTVLVGLIYFGIDPLKGRTFWRSREALRHLAFLSAALFALKGCGYYLNQFLLLFSERGAVFGPGYADIHASLLAIRVLFVLALVAGLAGLYGGLRSSLRPSIISLGALIAVSFALGVLYPGLVQKLVVEPNELERERPYIEHSITYTRAAYNLDRVERRQFPAGKTLRAEDIDQNPESINNIRLWDWQPLKTTYSQIQEMRPYYQFHDIDIDRYMIDGQYRQVMLSARELNQEALPAQAKTWVNSHLKFTHGYGVAMSPVNEVTEEGLPKFFLKDIPPQMSTDLRIDRPEIYFGEIKAPYVVVNTKEGEFDYPKGDQNVYAKYQGTGGVSLGSFFRRIAFALSFGDYRLVISPEVTPDSNMLYYRDIQQRVRKIAPFLGYDHDPYLVVADGRVFYMWDAYTTSRWYPYAEPYGNFNYIRNSVKVVIDAYNGTVTFFTADPDDPVIQSFSRIFPGMFKPMAEMPAELAAHIRYPEDLFKVQAHMYAVYHMQDPQVFYNKEDKWVLPTEMFGDEEIQFEPYYLITRLPGEDRAEFMIITAFNPQNKKNMIAWLGARCDPESYGRLLVYEFPKQELVYGPMQVEARINQDAQISSQLTLWDRAGSRVIRGNLLIIPIKDALLYVEPLYLQAEQSKLPELRRVIVVHGDRIVMEPTLDMALERIFTGRSPAPEEPGEETLTRTVGELAREANRFYEQAQESLKKGDWKGYGDNLEEMKKVLERLEKET